jgi:hypothetical protein
MLGLALFTATLALADKVTSDYNHQVDFSKYKTFMWVQPPETQDPFMRERIMDAINSQLTVRGLCQVKQGADLAIGANFATEEKQVWETYYSGGGWGWDGGSGWSTTEEKTYQVGTLTVDLFDGKSKQVVWQGIATDTLSRHPDKRTKDANKSIEKMFRDFPAYDMGN